jgi:hypothetical protein
VRLSQIHDTTKQGLITFAIAAAREKGVSIGHEFESTR